MSTSDNFILRSGENKDEQGLSVKQMSNVNEGLSDREKLKDNEGRQAEQKQRNANRVQCESAEDRAHRLHVQNEGKHPWPICFSFKSLLLTNIP